MSEIGWSVLTFICFLMAIVMIVFAVEYKDVYKYKACVSKWTPKHCENVK